MTMQNVADYIIQLQKTEALSRLFVRADGEIAFHDRGHFISAERAITPQFAFSDESVLSFADTLELSIDHQHVYDSATVTRVGGEPQTAAAVPGVMRKTFTLDGVLFANDRLSRIVAEGIVARFGVEQQMVNEWIVMPALDPSVYRALLMLDLGDRVTISFVPGGIGDAVQLDLILSKIGHSITADSHMISFSGTPTDPYLGQYFLFDDDAHTVDGATQGFNAGIWRP